MTRQMSYIMIIAGIIALLGQPPAIYAQHQWTSLNGPFWTQGVDVAYGKGGQSQAWHRYLIGSDSNEKNLYYWSETDSPWQKWDELPGANRLISYKFADEQGNKAFCTSHNDRVWRTDDGGANWLFVPGSQDLPNKQFAALEIDEGSLGTKCFLGSTRMENEASAYQGAIIGNQWEWNQIGESGLVSYDIHDLEYPTTGSGYLVAATDDGIWRIQPGIDYDWTQVNYFDDKDISVVEALDYHDAIWAATEIIDGHRRLYFSPIEASPPWDIIVEIQPDAASFDKVVNDIAAIHITDLSSDYQSIYIATEEGLFLLNMEGTNQYTDIAEFIDFQEDNDYFQNSPFKFDNRVLSLDYYQESNESFSRNILVGTEYGIYLVTEIRDQDLSIASISIKDISVGTFISKVKALSMPDNSDGNREIYTVTLEGLIKRYHDEEWSFIGTAFELDDEGMQGTDIITDFGGATDYILSSSKDASNGKLMYSSDGGSTWSKKTLSAGDPKVNAVDLSLVSANGYAAGISTNIWKSTNNGDTWTTSGSFSNPIFNDIYSDPDGDRANYAYLAGSGNVRAEMYNGSSWTTIEGGLSGVNDVRQFSKHADDDHIYAATEDGIFKLDLSTTPYTWSARTNGTGGVNMLTVACDPNNLYAILAASQEVSGQPKVWASGDSARSWVELSLGEMADAGVTQIYKIAATQDANSGFVIGTDKGVFHLDDIFRSGTLTSDEVWGPGDIIVNGDVKLDHGVMLTVEPGTDVQFVYDFDRVQGGQQNDQSELWLQDNCALEAIGTAGDSIVFSTSKSSEQTDDEWTGIVCYNGHPDRVDLQYCVIEYANRAVWGYWTYTDTLNIQHCRIESHETSGIDLYRPSLEISGNIANNLIKDCGTYGIIIRFDYTTAFQTTKIINNEIIDCNYGVHYTGGSNSGGTKKIQITDNIIRMSTEDTGNIVSMLLNMMGLHIRQWLRSLVIQ
jgi:photosystem II stability/assembly factor-like uncharacterized protein